MERRWESAEFSSTPFEAIIADRGQLDFDLLAAATALGVRTLQPARVQNLTREGDGWLVDAYLPSGIRRIRCSFVVDARGRSSRRLGRRSFGPPTVAVYGEWRGEVKNAVRLATDDTSWTWSAPTGARRRLAVAFTSPDALRRMEGSLQGRYRRLLDRTGVLETGLAFTGTVRVCDATPYAREDFENDLLRIGDADAALDPLSSSGVQAAIQSALCAGPVVNTLLDSTADHKAAIEYWNARRSARTTTHRTWSGNRYAEAAAIHNTEFWRIRAENASRGSPELAQTTAPLPSPGQILRLSNKTAIVEFPCLVNGLVRRAKCLSHPNLAEPIAYVDGIPLLPLAAVLGDDRTASAVVAAWASICPPRRALALLGWFWRHEIAIAC
jgi:Tryptophan halogenase